MNNKTRYLNQQEKETAKVMFANGSTVFQVALTLNRSHHAIKRVVTRPEVQAEIEDIRQRLIEKYQTLAENCVDKLLDKGVIDKASPRDLATISGISVDKARLLSDLSTQNLAVRSEPSICAPFDERSTAAILKAIKESQDARLEAGKRIKRIECNGFPADAGDG